MFQRTVLIVEDELLIRVTLADALEDEGYRVLEAGTVLEAVAILGSDEIDAIITDIDMPGGLNGLDLVRLVVDYRKAVPVLVSSGGHQIRDGMLPGHARFLPKPYSLDVMAELLAQLLAKHCDALASDTELQAA